MLGLLKGTFSAMIALGSGFLAGRYHHFHETQTSKLVYLSVGQGDCTLFQNQGINILIDAGPRTPWVDAGEKLVIPELLKHGVRSIDLLLLTHPDLDHIGGLKAIARRFKIGKIGVPAIFENDPFMNYFFKNANVPKERIFWIHEHVQARIEDFAIDMLEPPHKEGEQDNDGSLFVRITGPSVSAVFTGDASLSKEIEMIPYLSTWKASILKAGHHGSHHSTGEAWLKAVEPQYVILSCGRNNSYHHPHPITLKRIKAAGARFYRTDQNGSICFKLK